MIYGYIRVSTERQTVENQRYEILKYCEKNGLTVDAWIEESISGVAKPSARLLGKLILDRIKRGDLIMVTEISRLGRNSYMVMSIINHCLLCGADILPIWKGQVIREDSDSVYDTFIDIITAQKEREMISKRTKSTLSRLQENGVKLGRPVGTLNGRKLDGKEDDIQKLLTAGKSKAEIARIYNVNTSTLFEFIRVRINGGDDYKQKYNKKLI